MRSITRLKSSCVVGSIQWTSSCTTSTGCSAASACELLQQRFERQLLLALRRQFERRIALAGRDAEQRRDQRHGLVEPVRAARQQGLELVEPCRRRIIAREPGGALQLLDQRVQRTGCVMGRALVE